VAPFPPPFGGIASYVQDLMGSKLLKKSFDLYRVDTSRGESLIRGDGRGENTWGRWRLFLKPKNWAFLVYIVLNYFEFLGKLLITKPEVVHVHTCSYFGFIRSGGFSFLPGFSPVGGFSIYTTQLICFMTITERIPFGGELFVGVYIRRAST